MDMESLVARVAASREAAGLNVYFIREDGRPDRYSFATAEGAAAFRAQLERNGRRIITKEESGL